MKKKLILTVQEGEGIPFEATKILHFPLTGNQVWEAVCELNKKYTDDVMEEWAANAPAQKGVDNREARCLQCGETFHLRKEHLCRSRSDMAAEIKQLQERIQTLESQSATYD